MFVVFVELQTYKVLGQTVCLQSVHINYNIYIPLYTVHCLEAEKTLFPEKNCVSSSHS